MKLRILLILSIVGLIGSKALFADRTPKSDAAKHLKPFNCENPVEGEFLLQLKVPESNTHKLLRLNQQNNQFEVQTFYTTGGQIIAQQNIPQENLRRAFEANGFEATKVEPIQAMFKSGENHGKSPEGATDIFPEVKSQITKVIFKRQYITKKGEEVLGYPSKAVTKRFVQQLKEALGRETKFVSEVCQNVEPTTAPAQPNDTAYSWGDQWGLWNFGVWGIADVDMNYGAYPTSTPPAPTTFSKMYEVWSLYPADQIVIGVIGAGIDDEDAVTPTYQNADLFNVVGGSYVVPGLTCSSYFDCTTSTHELEVTGIAVAGNNNARGITGVTRGRIFLSVFDDGVTPLTNALLIEALDQASRNSEIINVSFMIRGDDPAIRSILETIASRGVVAVFGAGNNGEDLDNPSPTYNGGYPCRYNNIPGLNINIICVEGINADGTRGIFGGGASSNYGRTKVHIGAPGGGVMTTLDPSRAPYFEYTFVSGTSYSSPFIVGLMSLVKWYRPSLTPGQIKQIVIDPANRRDPPAPSTLEVVTGGIPDFLKVLQMAGQRVICSDADNSRGAEPTILDALALARMDAGLMPVRDRIADDVNGDGRVTVMDALRIAQYVVGFPVQLSCPGEE